MYRLPLLLLSLSCLLMASGGVTFSDADRAPKDGKVTEAEWNAYVKPELSSGWFSSFGSDPSALGDSEADASFLGGFFNSWTMIIATELGDKTFFIAAILCMKHSRVPVSVRCAVCGVRGDGVWGGLCMGCAESTRL